VISALGKELGDRGLAVFFEFVHEFGDDGGGVREFRAVEFAANLIERPRQELLAGRAVGIHVAFVVDCFVVILVVFRQAVKGRAMILAGSSSLLK
jgi:hypothetical protein